MSNFSKLFFEETIETIRKINHEEVDQLAIGLAQARDRGGRLFILGVGGSAGHASHAVNDFRKICQFEAYSPTDNVSELTARVNDEGWDSCFTEWLKGSRINSKDAILIFSVGGWKCGKKCICKSSTSTSTRSGMQNGYFWDSWEGRGFY